LRPLQAHVHAQPLNAHAIGIDKQRLETFLRREPRNAGKMTVQIPDTHDEEVKRKALFAAMFSLRADVGASF
jgi:hypothetical protein